MDNYIMFEGQKIPLTDEQIKTLELNTNVAGSPFDRVRVGENYYIVDTISDVSSIPDMRCYADNMRFEVANYCTDEKLMRQRALHEKLNRLLWKYSMEHGGDTKSWHSNDLHYCITKEFTTYGSLYDVSWDQGVKSEGCIYFATEDIAEDAIIEVVEPFIRDNPEFVW